MTRIKPFNPSTFQQRSVKPLNSEAFNRSTFKPFNLSTAKHSTFNQLIFTTTDCRLPTADCRLPSADLYNNPTSMANRVLLVVDNPKLACSDAGYTLFGSDSVYIPNAGKDPRSEIGRVSDLEEDLYLLII
jgi:hypothetical protein